MYDLGAFKLDQLQAVKLISFQKIFTFLTPFLITPERRSTIYHTTFTTIINFIKVE